MEKRTAQPDSKPPKANVFELLGPYKGMIVMLILFALLSNATNLLLPKLIGHAIDDFVGGKFHYKIFLLQFGAASSVIFLFTYFQSTVQTYASEKVARNLRTRVSEKISRQSFAFIIKANPSKLLTNLTSDIDAIKMFVSMAVVTIISSIFMILGTCILLFQINWKLALIVVSIVPIIMGTFFFVLGKVKVLFKQSREIIDRLNKIINESIMGAALIRVLNTQIPEYDKFYSTNTDAKNLGLTILRLFAILIPIIMLVANLAVVAILAIGGHYVIAGSMSLGELAAFNSYLSLLIFPILMIGFMSNIIAQANASYSRINEVLKTPEVANDGTCREPLSGRIQLQNVSLSYPGKPVLKNVSFTIEAGSRTAIIGPTAAGKSQLLYLLTNLITANEGAILFDGVGLHDFDREAFQPQIGFVFQDSVMFNLSLRENIAFNNSVSDASLSKAIETAELGELVNALPEKLDTILSERGTSLSGGQKQRIMLARALSVQPKILFLDDFTARVDKKTENKILCNLDNNYPNLTLVSVTQKIASVKHFDQIILLMEGEVLAKGTHTELLNTCPEYVQIYNSQRSTHHYEL